jgi:hypothetical protein
MSFYTGGTEVHIDPSRSGGVHGTRLLLLALFLTGAVAFLGIGYLLGLDDSPPTTVTTASSGSSPSGPVVLTVIVVEASATMTLVPIPTATRWAMPTPTNLPICETWVPGAVCETLPIPQPTKVPMPPCSEALATPSTRCVWPMTPLPTPDAGRYEQP